VLSRHPALIALSSVGVDCIVINTNVDEIQLKFAIFEDFFVTSTPNALLVRLTAWSYTFRMVVIMFFNTART
jgi:hypothetical protein